MEEALAKLPKLNYYIATPESFVASFGEGLEEALRYHGRPSKEHPITLTFGVGDLAQAEVRKAINSIDQHYQRTGVLLGMVLVWPNGPGNPKFKIVIEHFSRIISKTGEISPADEEEAAPED